jgi:uncharacterized protein (DUF427 family)
MLEPTPAIQRARAKWEFRGENRPPFAEPALAGEESVWDFPRPPVIASVPLPMRVVSGQQMLAATDRGVRVLETAGAPTYYFPPEDVRSELLTALPETSICEWKGIAVSFRFDNLAPVAWCYPETFPEFESIQGWYAFHPANVECFLDEEVVLAQSGGYYGGWVTRNLKGPIKGAPGTEAW